MAASTPSVSLTPRKQRLAALMDRLAPERAAWIDRRAYFHAEDLRFLRFAIPEGARVLEIGCGVGDLLAGLKPGRGVGIDLSAGMIEQARARHPGLEFHHGDAESPEALAALKGPFDFIILSDTVGDLEDIESTLGLVHGLCDADTRLIIAYHSRLWMPVLRAGEMFGLKMPSTIENWLSTEDIAAMLDLADFEVIRRDWRQLMPLRLKGLADPINKYLGTLPGIRALCLRNYVIARSRRFAAADKRPSCTVFIPARNEKGNIEPAVRRIPDFCDDLEILFVEGHSSDGTFEECQRVRDAHPKRDIKVLKQPGKGKGDAVRAGFEAARGEVLMILDADLTVPPEDLPKFYNALVGGKGEFINGSRLVYPMEREAMRFLNLIANHTFSVLFTWLLNQRFTDTLCGTKVLYRRHYREIAANRAYFGDFDPFGDFDLIFGAVKRNLKIVEIPIRYQARAYGQTQISRFTHGWELLKMVVFAYRKIKTV